LHASRNSSTPPDPHLWITVLAGGSGTRFWPLSTPRRPKQLLPLAGEEPLIRDTVKRALLAAPEERLRILAGDHLVESLRGALPRLPTSCFMVEPEPRGTAPVLLWAAWTLHREDPEAVLCSLHADHAIEPADDFARLLVDAAALAREEERLFTVAVPPSRPETGYGYIQPGESLATRGTAQGFRVASFVEKPDRETARQYLARGYLWNSGIFLWKASVFLEEVREVAPELARHLPLLEEGKADVFFHEAPKISVDEAVLERSHRVASVRATFQWDDVGAWEALSRTREPDEAGNVFVGSVHALEAGDNIVMAEEGSVVLFGVQELVVVRKGDVVLVAERRRTPELKSLLKILPTELKDPDS